MVKLVFVIRRRENMSPEEFHRYWLDEHGPLAERLLSSIGARRYVQSHTIETELNAALGGLRGCGEVYDGLAEVWWDSLDAMAAAATSEEGQRAGAELIEDEAKFIDFARSSIFMTEEHAVIDG